MILLLMLALAIVAQMALAAPAYAQVDDPAEIPILGGIIGG
jgi:hypothetical protein